MKLIKSFIVLFFACLILVSCENKDVVIYVSPSGNDTNSGSESSPLATVEAAQKAVRQAKSEMKSGNISVVFRDGIFSLDKPIVLSNLDGGTDNITVKYKSYRNETPVFSGGRKLKGTWEKGGNNIWAIEIPEVYTEGWDFRQLFKNGVRQVRSRYPNNGERLTIKDFEETGHDIEKAPRRIILNEDIPFENLRSKQTEVVMYNLWSISRAMVTYSSKNTISTQTPLGWIGHGISSVQKDKEFYLENAYEFIDKEGEWYLDRDKRKLFVKTKEGEDPNESEWEVPVIDQLLRLIGSRGNSVKNVSFEGLTFKHARWQLPLFGYNGIQAGFFGSTYIKTPTYSPLMAILWQYTDNCEFTNCELLQVGTSGMGLGAGCSNSKISNNKFDDIGGTGIMTSWRRIANEPPRQWFENDWTDPLDIPRKNRITDNRISNCGEIHYSSTGALIAFSEDTYFAHNEIFDMPHIGITVGFIWGDETTSQKRCIVEKNNIHHCMKKLMDGAGIYTLGYQPGTIIRNNYVHDILNGAGLYTDEGSSHIVFENNIICRTGMMSYTHNYGHHNVLRNNIFAFPCLLVNRNKWGDFTKSNLPIYKEYSDYSVIRRNRADFDVENSYSFTNNIVVYDRGAFYRVSFAKGSNNLIMENNVIYNTKGDPVIYEDDVTIEQWQARGHDLNSVYSDPMFKDIQNNDFELLPGSPALKLGFKNIDISDVGPRN